MIMAEDNFKDNEEKKIHRSINRRTFFAFGVFVFANAAGIMGWRWLRRQPQDDGALKPLRNALNLNEKVNNNFFSSYHLAPQYPKEQALPDARVNGDAGIKEDFDFDTWSLTINRHPDKPDDVLELNMDTRSEEHTSELQSLAYL